MSDHSSRRRRFTTTLLLTLAASVVVLTVSATTSAAGPAHRRPSLAFSPAVHLAAGGLHTTFVAVGDLNGDGNLDIVAVNYTAGNASVFLGDGHGGFSAPALVNVGATPKACVLQDMDGNGTLDLVVTDEVPNAVAVLKGNGLGGFGAPVMYPVGASSEELAVVDLNNDGRPDIVSVNDATAGLISILLARSGGYQLKGPIAAGSNPRDVSAADFNRDGNMDVVVAYEGDTVLGIAGGAQLWLGNGKGSLRPSTQVTAGATPKAVSAGDFNRDGAPDFIVSSEGTNDVSLFLGDGAGRFSRSATVGVGVMPKDVVAADISGDGLLDAIATDYMDDNIAVLLGDGQGHLGAPTYMAVGSGPKSVAIADINNDGKPDAVTADNDGSTVSLLLSVLTTPSITGLTADPATISPNADGYQDKTTITYTTNQSLFNSVAIYDDSGTLMRTLKNAVVLAAGPQTLTWDGKYTPAGGTSTPVPDGTYTVRVTGQDAAGNAVQSSTPVVVDTTISKISVNYPYFSPNGDGRRDATTISYTLKSDATVTVLIRDGSGATVRTIQDGVGQIAGVYSAVWDGTLTDGSVAPEGAYTAVVQAVNAIGTVESVKPVTVDLTPPVVTDAMVAPSPFVPPATTTASFGVNEAGTVSVSILDSTNTVVRTLTQAVVAGPNNVIWDGTMTGGATAAPGKYAVKLSVNDLASNKATVYPIVLSVDVGV
jgi:flagellar hook assembly protein FlgD